MTAGLFGSYSSPPFFLKNGFRLKPDLEDSIANTIFVRSLGTVSHQFFRVTTEFGLRNPNPIRCCLSRAK